MMVFLLFNVQYVSNQQLVSILPIICSLISARIATLSLFVPNMIATIAVAHTIVIKLLLDMVN